MMNMIAASISVEDSEARCDAVVFFLFFSCGHVSITFVIVPSYITALDLKLRGDPATIGECPRSWTTCIEHRAIS